MIAAGLDVFDRTVHKTYEWLADVMRLLAVDERPKAYRALRATLHALRDRLNRGGNEQGEIEDAKHILPSELRELWP